jgi:hypothetical protein
MRLRLVALAAIGLGIATAACSAILGLQPPPSGGSDGGTTVDGKASEGGLPADGSVTDSSPTLDGEPSDGACVFLDAALPPGTTDAATTFNPLADEVENGAVHTWTFFNVATVNVNLGNFEGGAFDGRYVYFVPLNNGLVVRYDTSAQYTLDTSWSTFDTTTLDTSAQQFRGAVFDGQYLYLVPYTAGDAGLVARYDTTNTGAFGASAASWELFDTTTIPVPMGATSAAGFSGGTFDGRYVYFVPNAVGATNVGRVARFDTTGTFGSTAAWDTFDVSGLNASALGFIGGIYDGRHVYLVPNHNGGQANHGASGVVVRYDSASDGGFANPTSWASYDITQINANAYTFAGGAYDGQYVYFVPRGHTAIPRFDTHMGTALNFKAGWDTFDYGSIVPSSDAGPAEYAGGAFDGRFVYFIPATVNGPILRYDTLSDFDLPCAWTQFSLTSVEPSLTGGFGAVYDGRYLYLVPRGTFVARFDTKTATWMPALAAYKGSFL